MNNCKHPNLNEAVKVLLGEEEADENDKEEIAEVDVDEVGVDLTRQGLFEKGQKLVSLGLGHEGHRLVHLGDDLPLFVDVGTADAGDAGLVGAEPASELGYFFIVHGCVPLFGRNGDIIA